MFSSSNANELREQFAFVTVSVFPCIYRLLVIVRRSKALKPPTCWVSPNIDVHIFVLEGRFCSFKFLMQSSSLWPTEWTNNLMRFSTVGVENGVEKKNRTGTVNL
jgi:hypothetical protein